MKYYLPGSLRQTGCSETFTTMAMCFHVATWYTLSNVLVTLTVASPVLQLSGEPDTVADGDALLLSCNRNTPETPPLFAVIWSRNTEEIFQTLEAGGLSNISNTSEYNEVAGRLNVTTNKQSHKIILQINSSLDDGSVWRCHIGNYYSNSFTVEVLIPTTVATTVEVHIRTTVTHYGPSSTEKSPSDVPKVYVIAGSCAGLVIVIVTVIAIAVCMKHIAVGKLKNTERVKAVQETEDSEIVMVENVCYVGLGDVQADTTTEGASLQGNVPGSAATLQ
ncbi:uncharacterized protein [Haliotis asinina]|uniref:uncharacterized protein n=1 Tax=Haliotis asinina TaxID=109174 RepID=UPI003531C509